MQLMDDELINRFMLGFYSPSTRITGVKCLHVLDVFGKSMLMEPEKKDEVGKNITRMGKCLDVLDAFRKSMLMKKDEVGRNITRMGKCLHVLEVFRKSKLMGPEKKDEVERNHSLEFIQLASATELSDHGIQFERSKTNSLNDVSFAGRVLTLPEIWVDDSTKSMFLNLMAFERSHAGAGNQVMSYIYCMAHLISNGQDIALLRTQGIILNILYSDEATAKMFGSLANGVIIDPNCSLIGVLEKVNKYYKKRWNMWRANFIHTDLRNPWVTLSLIAAVFLFALTTIQTVYSVLGSRK